MKKLLITSIMISGILSLCGCGNTSSSNSNSSTATTSTTTTSSEDTSEAAATTTTASSYNSSRIFTYNYVHGDEGYFNLLNDMPEFRKKAQSGGSCWAYAAAASMETSYFLKNGKNIEIDPMRIIDTVWNQNKSEGFIKKVDTANADMGGWQWMVTQTLSNKMDGITLDSAKILTDTGKDAIKEAVQTRGGIVVSVPDDEEKIDWFGEYYTMNDPKNENVDHAVTIIGWDDSFPKNYFSEKASQNGAWIAYNSAAGIMGSYYYISYDTPLKDVVSFTAADKFSEVLSYDAGNEQDKYITRGDATTVANVFHKAGKLAAIGTYNDFDAQDIKIDIYDAGFKTLLYTQDATLSYHGYQTVDLNTILSVNDYAVIITYTKGAPVEGQTIDYDTSDYVTVSDKGQSFVFLGDWKNKASIFHEVEIPEGAEEAPQVDHTYDYIKDMKDMSDDDIKEALGIDFEPHNCCIKALYTY